jgi:hypothetical protein
MNALEVDEKTPDKFTEDDIGRIDALRLKIFLGDPEAISEANKIAKKGGYSGYQELIIKLDDVYDHIAEGDDTEDSWVYEGFTRYFLIGYSIVKQYLDDFPMMAQLIAKSVVKDDDLLFREILDDDFNELRTILDGTESKPLPPRPSIKASIDEWFDYYAKRKELGIPLTMEEIAKYSGYSHDYLRQLHMRYNYSQENSKKKKKNN